MTTTNDVTDDVNLAMLEYLEEAMTDPSITGLFAREDIGWARVDGMDDGEVISREVLVREARRARLMSVADPLIRRAVGLHIAYVHGQGCTIQAKQEEGAEQDLNAVVQAFLDDPSNLVTFTSQQAREELERKFKTDGNAFHCLITSPLTGRVQVRSIPFREIVDIITDPEDGATPWFYKRTYTVTVVEAGYDSAVTRSRRETRTVLYPALGYRPNVRPKSIDSKPVEWDKPVIHTAVNRVDGAKWGAPDLLAALPWALGYKEFLQDWARLVKALSRYAFRATSKGRNVATIRARLEAAPVTDSGVGATVVTGEGQKFEAIGKSGATIDSDSGRPLAAMVAAACDVPVTMLLADPGVTGARATAETLDQPLRLVIRARQSLHAALYQAVLGYVVDQAVKAPQGSLTGTVRIDRNTGREVIVLAGDQVRSVTIDWPAIDKVSVDVLVKAIVEADGTRKLPPLVVAKLLLLALDVDDIDELLAELVDDQGNWVDPDATAGNAAVAAFRKGTDPATVLNGVPPVPPVPPVPDPAKETT